MKSIALRVLAAVLVCACPQIASAALVGSSVSGPGGFGFDGGTFSNVTEPVLHYTSINYLDVFVTVTSAGSYDINEAPGLGGISNFTGQHWVGFEIVNLTPELGSFAGDWSYYTSPFGSIVITPTTISISGGAGVPDLTGMAVFGTFLATGEGTIILRETPIVVPEAASLMMVGSALLLGSISVLRVKRRV